MKTIMMIIRSLKPMPVSLKTQESTISTHNASQVGTSTSTHTPSFRVPTRVVDQRQNTHNPQSH